MINELFYKGSFGLERETMRVDRRKRLAVTPHPFEESRNITRDFCESQTELITPVCSSVHEVMMELEKLDKKVRTKLDMIGEDLWLYSNPPIFEKEADINLADFKGNNHDKKLYREQLEKRYGKRLMLFSGIHFNFSFDDEYLKSLYDGDDFPSWRDSFYLKLYKQLSIYSWLPLLLTAASPIYDRSLDKDGASGKVMSKYSSMRNSERGYWNEFVPILRFESLNAFTESIKEYINKGMLLTASELYLPIRLKPKGENNIDNFKNGISHIELRMFDIDPMQPLGIDEMDLEFTHFFIMYLSLRKDIRYTQEMQEQAVEDHKNAALYDLTDVYIGDESILEKAEQILDDISGFFGDDRVSEVIEHEKRKLKNRICERVSQLKM